MIQEFTLFSASAIAATFHAASRVVVFLPVLVQKPILVLLCFLAMSKPLHRRLGSDEEEERSQGRKAPVSGRFDVRSNLGTAELQGCRNRRGNAGEEFARRLRHIGARKVEAPLRR